MKIIRNTSLQGLSLTLNTPDGLETKYLFPKQSIEVPGSWGGKILENLVSRRMVKVVEVADPAPPTPVQAPTKRKKVYKG